jgi:PKD repeat protein
MQSIEQNPTMDYTNFSSVDTTFNISLAVASIYGCTDSIAHALVVHPTPTAVFNLSQPTACSPAPIVITNNSTNADSYTWSYGDGSSDNIADSTHVHVFQTPLSVQVNYTITLTATTDAGCVSTTTAPFTLYPLITTDFSVNASGCTPVQAFFANQSTGANSYAWDFGDGSTSTLPLPNHVFNNETAAPIDYTITMIGTSSYGCSDTSSTTITVNPKPHALFTLDATNGCGPVDATLTNMSTNAVSYSWVYGDATSSTVADSVHTHQFVNPSNQPQTFNVTLVAIGMDGCTSQYMDGLQVYPHVTADFANLGEFCSPATVYVDNNSTNANTYAWNFGNGLMSNDANPTVFFQNNTMADVTYNVTLVATSNYGCTDTLTKPIVIHPKPMADFSLSASAACTPAPVMITNNSTLATSYTWNYGDGTNDTNADAQHSHTFQTPVNGQSYYTINLIAKTDAGCTDTTSAQFNLYPQVVAAFTGNAAGCSPYQSFFVNQSVGAVTYAWSFSDGTLSSETNPSHIFTTGNTTDQTFVAQLVAINQFGCSDTTQSNIEVYHTPLAVALLDSLTSCYPQVATLANASIGANSFQWAYGTGETNSTSDVTHTHTFYNLGSDLTTYHVSLVASTDHGCTSTDMVDVEVAPALNTTFAVNAHGCTPVVAYFDNTSDNAVSYHWDFGDGDSSNEFEPSHTFFNWGIGDTTYTVTLTSFNLYGCTETFQAEVVVYSAPVADFTVAPSIQTWPSATVALDNTTSGGTLSYSWYMGDATELYVAEPGSYTYSTWGEYTIRLIASNGACSDTAFQSISILPPPPVAAFTGPAEGCAPLVVQFQNQSQYAQSSDWQFGDGGVANATNPVYTFWTPGTYTVTLTIHGYDGSTDVMVQEQIIHVYPTAIASFICTPNQVSIPSQPVYCMNHSQNASIYHWEFGDGNTSSEESPVYYYTQAGVYDVTLIADNQYHCPDTITVVSAVYADNNGLIDFPNAFTPSTTGGNGGAYDPMGYNNDVFFPLHAGVTEYNLQIFNKWGELLFESKDVHRGWDGYYNGLLSPEDVYAWKVRARLVNGQLLEKAGDVTLLVK